MIDEYWDWEVKDCMRGRGDWERRTEDRSEEEKRIERKRERDIGKVRGKEEEQKRRRV